MEDEGQVISSQSDSSFLRFANICELVRSTTSKLKKIDYVSQYLNSLQSDEDLSVAATFLSGKIFPPGLMKRDINVGYSLIWKSISALHGIRFSDLSTYYLKHGDIGSAVEDYLNSRGITSNPGSLLLESDLSLADVFSTFKELTRAAGKGSTDKRQRILKRLLSSAQEPVEAKYLLRIMSAEMRIGLVEGLVEESITKAFSKTLTQVRTANLVTGDIGLVAILARKNQLDQAKLELFRPTNFMLADSAQNASELFLKFKEEVPLISDFKYDGIRAKIHSVDVKVKLN